MDFDFSDEQEQLRAATQRWVAKTYTPEHRRATLAEGGFSRSTWQALADLGLTALYVPPPHGGLGLGPIEAMVAMEALGYGRVLEPIAQSWIASTVLERYAQIDVQNHWLPRIASGDALVTLALQERRNRYRVDVCESKAVATADGYALTAHKSLVPAGDQADAWLVPAQLHGTLALFVLERQAPGVSVRGYATQDGSRAAEIEAESSPASLLTTDGLAALEWSVDVGSTAVCAEALGVLEATWNATIDHLRQRQQFGVPLASFQVLRHRVADMKMQLELARSMSYYASMQLLQPPAVRRRAVAQARVQLGQAMRWIGQQAVQLHGGMGVTDECMVAHCFRHLTQLEMRYGDSQHHLGEVAARMLETAGLQ